MKHLLVLLVACGSKADDRASRAKGTFHEIVIPTPPGLSGLAADDRDHLYAVPERNRDFVELTLDGKVTLHPMIGFPPDVDTEGLAWLGGNHFAISTEGQEAATASVIYADLVDGKLVAGKTRTLSDAELGVTLTGNHGAEGACGSGDDVLVAIESVGHMPDGKRWAPVARIHAGTTVTVSKVVLTSDVGKLSALDCKLDPDGTAHVWSIERHYGVSKILHFDVPVAATTITPQVKLDLAPILEDSLNLEGIVQLSDGRLVAINDNQGKTIDGPSELVIFEPGVGTK